MSGGILLFSKRRLLLLGEHVHALDELFHRPELPAASLVYEEPLSNAEALG